MICFVCFMLCFFIIGRVIATQDQSKDVLNEDRSHRLERGNHHKPHIRGGMQRKKEFEESPLFPLMLNNPSEKSLSHYHLNLFEVCPQLSAILRLQAARLFQVRLIPSYYLALYPQGEIISDYTVKQGSWDSQLISALASHLNFYPGQVIVNAGGNIGTLAIYYAKAGFEVFTMEPHPLNYMLLNCSVHLNHLEIDKQIHIYQTALGNQTSGSICFTNVYEWNMGIMGINGQPPPELNQPPLHSCQFSAPITSLRHFIEQRADTFRNRFLMLLLDVEGYEPVILKDLQKVFSNPELRPRLVAVETGCERWKKVNQLATCQEVVDLLLKHKYVPIWPLPAIENLLDFLYHNKLPRPQDDNVIFAIREDNHSRE